MTAASLIKAIKKAGGKLVKNVDVFDIYKGEHIEKGYKSVAINIIYSSNDHTLTDDEVNETHKKIVEELNKKFEANIRG